MNVSIAFMLGLGKAELPQLKRFISNEVNFGALKLFDELFIGVPKDQLDDIKASEDYEEFHNKVSKIVRQGIHGLEKFSIKLIGITGGPHVGINRADLLTGVKSWLDDDDYVMMFDLDDDFHNLNYLAEVIKLIKQDSSKSKDLIDFNYICDDFSRVIWDTPQQCEPAIILNAWNLKNYDSIEGYRYYNPRIHASGVAKLFKIGKINIGLFSMFPVYEDSYPFVELMSRTNKIGLIPYATIIYNRKNSGILVDKTDKDLEEVRNFIDPVKNNKLPGNLIPYIALCKQIDKWREK